MVESTESESDEEILEPSAAQTQVPTEVESENLAFIPFNPLQVYYVEHADDVEERDEVQKLKDRIEELEFQNQKLDYLCWVKQHFNDKFKDVLFHNMEDRKKKAAEFKSLKEQFDLLTEEYVKLSNKYDEVKLNYVNKVGECECLEKEYIRMADKYDEWKQNQRMAKEDVDTSDEEFIAEPEKGDKNEVSETLEVPVRITRARAAVADPESSSIPDPDEAEAQHLAVIAEVKRKLDAIPEIGELEVPAKKIRTEEVQVEPVMIEALEHDDDWYNEVEMSDDDDLEQIVQTESTSDADLTNLEEKFDYLVQKKYNKVYLDQLTVSQVHEEYEKCVLAEARGPTDPDEIGVEEGEWTQPDAYKRKS